MSPLRQGQFEDLHCHPQIWEKMNYPGTTKGEDYHELETARIAQVKFAAIYMSRPNAFCRKSSRLAVPQWKWCSWRLSGLPNQIPIQINDTGVSSVPSCWLSLPSPQWNMSFQVATGNVLLQDFLGPGLLQGWLRKHLLAAEIFCWSQGSWGLEREHK